MKLFVLDGGTWRLKLYACIAIWNIYFKLEKERVVNILHIAKGFI